MEEKNQTTRQLATACLWCYRLLLLLIALPFLFLGYLVLFKAHQAQGALFLAAGVLLLISEFMFRYLDRQRRSGQ